MIAKRLIRLVKINKPKPGTWGPLSEPINALDNFTISRAQSLMSPTPKGGACPPLTLEQAVDVLRWAGMADRLGGGK